MGASRCVDLLGSVTGCGWQRYRIAGAVVRHGFLLHDYMCEPTIRPDGSVQFF